MNLALVTGYLVVARGLHDRPAGAVNHAGEREAFVDAVAKYVREHGDDIRIRVIVVVEQHEVVHRREVRRLPYKWSHISREQSSR